MTSLHRESQCKQNKLSWHDITNDANCLRITKLEKKTIKLHFSAFCDIIYQNLLRKFVRIAFLSKTIAYHL